MYTDKNFKTKKALKDAIAEGEKIMVYQPGPFGGGTKTNCTVAVEGPHAPEPHRWYASVTLDNEGYITKVS